MSTDLRTIDADEVNEKLMPGPRPWQQAVYGVIFGHATLAGKAFDLVLLAAICLSVVVVMLESVTSVRERHASLLFAAEWVFTGLFTVEYGLRLVCVRRSRQYAWSFFGVVDVLAILPTYLSLFIPGAQGLATVRGLRLLRIFRILKITQFVSEAAELRATLWQSRAKIIVFLMTVLIVACIIGALMYVVEGGPESKFKNIPLSIYWAIVTMATVGYGDIVPVTAAGKFLSVILIVFGYSMIVVPTGIVSAEFSHKRRTANAEAAARICPNCSQVGHDRDATFCNHCGSAL